MTHLLTSSELDDLTQDMRAHELSAVERGDLSAYHAWSEAIQMIEITRRASAEHRASLPPAKRPVS